MPRKKKAELHAADPIADHIGHKIRIIDRRGDPEDVKLGLASGPITITCTTCGDDIAWEE